MIKSIFMKVIFSLSKHFAIGFLLKLLRLVKFDFKVTPYEYWDKVSSLIFDQIKVNTRDLYQYSDRTFSLAEQGRKEIPIGDPIIEIFVSHSFDQSLVIQEMEIVIENIINIEHAGGKGGGEAEDVKFITPEFEFKIDCRQIKQRIVNDFEIVTISDRMYLEIKKFPACKFKLDIPAALSIAPGKSTSFRFLLQNYIENIPTYIELKLRIKTNFGEISSVPIGLEQIETANIGYG